MKGQRIGDTVLFGEGLAADRWEHWYGRVPAEAFFSAAGVAGDADEVAIIIF